MNNQMPYGFFPQYNNQNNELKMLLDKIEYLEKRILKLEKKVAMIEGNTIYPPQPRQEFPNNYMI